MNKPSHFRHLLILCAVCILVGLCTTAQGADNDEAYVNCKLDYDLKTWSFLYKSGKGQGTISCDNGQTAAVRLRSHGGGVTFGKSHIEGGQGEFSRVSDISELFGRYAATEAHAGASKSAGAQAVWNGKIGLSLSGTGRGWALGFALGSFKIEPDRAAAVLGGDAVAEVDPSFETQPVSDPAPTHTIAEEVPIKPKSKASAAPAEPIKTDTIEAEANPQERYELFFEEVPSEES